jgi:photosystem II stability/assembly factor-like uncharacterized protein
MISALILAAILTDGQQVQLKDPATKTQERQKFHMPDVTGEPMRDRLQAYDQRMKLLGDSPFRNIMWRSIGSEFHGARVVDVDSPLNNPDEILVSFSTGGLWRTTNYGDSWEPLFDNQSATSIGDVAVSNDGQTIWMGTGENNNQRTSYAGTGVFKSTDAGKTWTNMGLNESHHIGRIVMHPKNKDTVFVAAVGPLYSQGGERGVYKTTDGGKTWNPILTVDKYTGVIDLVMDPRNPDIMVAAAYDRDRRAWNYREGGPSSAIYRTTDGGKTWSVVPGLPKGDALGREGLAMSRSNPNVIYMFHDNQAGDVDEETADEKVPAGVLTVKRFRYLTDDTLKAVDKSAMRVFLQTRLPEGTNLAATVDKIAAGELKMVDVEQLLLQRDPEIFTRRQRMAEVWRSDDTGKTWRCVSGRMGDHGGYYWNQISVHPTNPDEVYTCGLELLKSVDGGKSWESIAQSNHVDHHVYWIDPRNPKIVVNGNDGSPDFSSDGGKTWREVHNLAVGQWTTVAVDNKVPFNVFGGLQDNGTVMGPSTHRSGISPITNWKAIGGGDGSAVTVDPRNGGDIVYTASQFGAFAAQNLVTKERWSARPRPGRGEVLRFNWVAPLIISPHHPDIIYAGSQKLHRSFTQGRTWETISDDLTKNLPNGDVPFSTLTCIAESPFKFGRLYVGADDGTIKTSPDGGVTWQDISTPANDRWVTRLIASRYANGRLYVTQNGYRQDEWKSYVWRSDDHGATWKSIVGNLPAEPVNVIREDPVNENILYVGTDMGVYATRDGGQHWMTLGGGMPSGPVHDIAIQDRDRQLVAATHSRSAWLIDLKPLEDLTDELIAEHIHMFEVQNMSGSDAWPYERRADWDKSLGRDRLLTGQFWAGISGKGKVALVDKDGKEVVSKEMDIKPGYIPYSLSLMLDPGKPVGPVDPKTGKTAEEALQDPNQDKRARYVPKGTYKIVVTVGSEKAEVAWTLS